MGFLSLRLFYFSLMTFSGPCITQRIKIQVKNVLSLTVLRVSGPLCPVTIQIIFQLNSQDTQ